MGDLTNKTDAQLRRAVRRQSKIEREQIDRMDVSKMKGAKSHG